MPYMMTAMRYGPCIASLILAGAPVRPAGAQQRPLPIEGVEGAGAGNVILQTGVDYTRDARFTLSGLDGQLWRVGLIRIDVGLSSIADFELSGGLRDHLKILSVTPAVLSDQLHLSDPSSTGAFDDLIVGTKIGLLHERSGLPGVAFRVATRLPNAKHPSGLGQDTSDFYSTVIVGHSVSATRITGNVGVGVLGDPLRGNRHVESLMYGVELRRPIARATLVAGIDGRTGPMEPGLESRAIARAGAVWTRGPARVELDGTVGLTSRDGNVGFALTAGYTFHAFSP
jgi:hypothetical protein